MKWLSAIILVVLLVAVATPTARPIIVCREGTAAFVTLDLCHSSTPAVSSAGKMPAVNGCVYGHIPGMSITVFGQNDPLFTQLLLISRNERPPQI